MKIHAFTEVFEEQLQFPKQEKMPLAVAGGSNFVGEVMKCECVLSGVWCVWDFGNVTVCQLIGLVRW